MAHTYSPDLESLAYASGSTEFTAGETITGATSSKTAVVVSWTLTGGTWGGTAAGIVWIDSVSGAFQAENINGSTGGANMATVAGPSVAEYSDLNWCRIRIGDTDDTYPLFVDAEINAVITKCTGDDGIIDYDKVQHILLQVLAIDPIRIVESRKAHSGSISLIDELDNYQLRSEAFGD